MVASKESGSRGFLLAVVALVGFAVVMVWALVGPQTPADPEPTSDPEPAAAPAEPATAATPEPEPEPAAAAPAEPAAAAEEPPPAAEGADLFAGEMPDFMAELHMRVLDKKRLGAHQQKQLYEWGKEHPDDARPQLLLAWDSMNRNWEGIGVRMYRIAFRADPRAKDDPSMLRDLLAVASKYDKTEYREAAEIIEEAYGEQALPRVDQAIARNRAEGKRRAVERLQRLRARLSGEG